ncbi:hypothetical protein STEG23_036434, partial [Scotinomys teguina]
QNELSFVLLIAAIPTESTLCLRSTANTGKRKCLCSLHCSPSYTISPMFS